MPLLAIFIDDGGVMNDNSKRGEQWMDLVAQYFVPRYGGEPKTWREANHQVLEILIDELETRINESQNLDYGKHQALEDEIWINHMFDTVGVDRPPEQEYFRICREAENWVTPQVNAAIDGIIPAIKKLKSEGFQLYTASGETSWTLHGYLLGMGLLDCFITLYGPDLLGMMKGGDQYYKEMFVHAQVDPSHALVIDDNPKMLQLANQLGAFTIQSCVLEGTKPGWKHYYTSPGELSKSIERITT